MTEKTKGKLDHLPRRSLFGASSPVASFERLMAHAINAQAQPTPIWPTPSHDLVVKQEGMPERIITAEQLVALPAARAEAELLISRVGRPRIEDQAKTAEALKPWKAAGMSRATWYNRQKEKKAGNER